jgi:DNA-binding LacI/PurR family transcriptional regulator
VLAGATERSRAAKYQIVMQSCDYNSPSLADDLTRNIRQSRVPEDVSVVGFDDSPLASQVWPALTTIRQPISDMAAEAAELLLSTLRGEPADNTKHMLPSTLTFRQSTGPAPNRVRPQATASER